MFVEAYLQILYDNLQPTTAFPVFLIFGVILLFMFSYIHVRMWLIFASTAAFMFTTFVPLFFFSPYIPTWLHQCGLISEKWLSSEDIMRNVGLGLTYTLFFILMITYTIISIIRSKLKLDQPLEKLIRKKYPTTDDYLKLHHSKIIRYQFCSIKEFDNFIKPSTKYDIDSKLDTERNKRLAYAWVMAGLPVEKAINKVLIDEQFGLVPTFYFRTLEQENQKPAY
ncbi:hypothetical protein [Paenibacillus thiaminolyticus]|uniref:Uncharacterized protein n=1 Tax=Paenibacillus thiaminolyticus TaxID=49283 RepID=A0A3A3GYN4_PANTH|nr:hypothetical protein [Paenibacillus thiaminolyticus]RJG21327.1 hypothetical protein DQX05_21735 [Paenibacillus thiaminolyticus]